MEGGRRGRVDGIHGCNPGEMMEWGHELERAELDVVYSLQCTVYSVQILVEQLMTVLLPVECLQSVSE